MKIDDVAKPMSFDKSLESFFLEDFHLRPRNCSTLVDKFTAMGLSDPIIRDKVLKMAVLTGARGMLSVRVISVVAPF